MQTLKNKLALSLALALCALALPAHAVPVAPGGVVPTPGTTVAARPELAGLVVQDHVQPFAAMVGGVVVKGTIQDRVVRESSTGLYDFYTRINLNSASNAGLIGVARSSFGSGQALVDADWRIDGLGTVPSVEAARSATGADVLFMFNGAIAPGEESRFLLIHTRARRYNNAGIITLLWQRDGVRGAIRLRGFQPAY